MPNIMTEFNEAVVKELRLALEVIENIKTLHVGSFWASQNEKVCDHCAYTYPCPTIAALEEA